jgi:hypothetical protein
MCGKVKDRNSYYTDVVYDEDYDAYLCGKCSNDFADAVEEHEIRKRERIARDNEY